MLLLVHLFCSDGIESTLFKEFTYCIMCHVSLGLDWHSWNARCRGEDRPTGNTCTLILLFLPVLYLLKTDFQTPRFVVLFKPVVPLGISLGKLDELHTCKLACFWNYLSGLAYCYVWTAPNHDAFKTTLRWVLPSHFLIRIGVFLREHQEMMGIQVQLGLREPEVQQGPWVCLDLKASV